MLVPFAFYIVAFFLGQDVMYIPYANHPPYYVFYNARFGAEMAAPVAVFIATLAQSARRWHTIAEFALLAVVVGQTVVISWGGVISLQDGQTGLSCNVSHPIVAYLAQHYNGGRILIDEYHSQIDLSSAKVAFRDEIYEGDGMVWDAALHDPSAYVGWLIVVPHDLISQQINLQSSAFQRDFILVAIDTPTGAKLWHRRSSSSLPTRPLRGYRGPIYHVQPRQRYACGKSPPDSAVALAARMP